MRRLWHWEVRWASGIWLFNRKIDYFEEDDNNELRRNNFS